MYPGWTVSILCIFTIIIILLMILDINHFNRNIIHGSDAVESANKEIALWFSEKEVVSWSRASDSWVYGEN